MPDLPYARDALAPHVSPETLALHHGGHHGGYVRNLNKLLTGHRLADVAVEELIRRIAEVAAPVRRRVLENAGQHFNHAFYWRSLRPPSDSGPGGAFLDAVRESFGSLDALRAAFTGACVGHFGSGWGWLVRETDGSLKVVDTHDGGTPLPAGQVPLLVCDVWEHAYYLDHRSDRTAYLESYWKVADWEFAERNFEAPVPAAR